MSEQEAGIGERNHAVPVVETLMREPGHEISVTRIIGAGAFALVTAQVVFAQTYAVRDLGALPGNEHSHASRVNTAGQVAGYSTDDAIFGPNWATLWQADASMVDLRTLGGNSAVAVSINDLGLVVGYSTVSPGIGAPSHAFAWTASRMEDLGTLGGPASWAGGVNRLGEIVGSAQIASVESFSHPCFWDEYGFIHDLGVLPFPDHCCGAARAINSSGQIVGYSTTVFAQPRATLWTWEKGGVQAVQDLGVLPGGCCSDAYDVNDAGQVVGFSRINGASAFHAFLRNAGDGSQMTDLGALPEGTNSMAYAINANGLVVGMSWTDGQAPGDPHGVLWRDQSICDLNVLAPEAGDWTVIEALGINDAGQIVGVGMKPATGVTHGLLLTPVMGLPGDFNGDGDVDLVDYQYLQRFITGPHNEADPPSIDVAGCFQPLDFDDDGDLDLHDVSVFANSFTGAN